MGFMSWHSGACGRYSGVSGIAGYVSGQKERGAECSDFLRMMGPERP